MIEKGEDCFHKEEPLIALEGARLRSVRNKEDNSMQFIKMFIMAVYLIR